MLHSKRAEPVNYNSTFALAISCTFYLSACGIEGLPSGSDAVNPSLGAATSANSEGASGKFTGELLSEGSIRLSWPRDPSAISYLIMSNGKAIASLPAFNLSAVVKTDDISVADSIFAIVSVNASNIQTTWVSEPTMSNETPAVEAPPVVQVPPAVQVPPVEEVSPIETVNLAPDITDTSYNCDPAIESISFTVGETDQFTLSVTDESPLTLTYNHDSSKDGVVSVEVDTNGVFTISALQTGATYLWLSAKDDEGLSDEYELRVVVQ